MSSATESVVRLVHFSDLHLTARPLGWTMSDVLSRRITGWVNWYAFGRAHRFRFAESAGRALVHDIQERRPDAVVFSGDATFLGFDREVQRAAEVLAVGDARLPPGLAVPGNHDLYTPAALTSGAFERCFANWQHGERVDSDIYPFARRIGHLWLVAVNSASPQSWPWDATGEVGSAQLQRLRRLLAQIDGGPRILVTHYPVSLSDGRPEKPWHGLRDLEKVVRIAADGGIGLWLHGHRHHWYFRPPSNSCPFPTIGSGSVAQFGAAGCLEYQIRGNTLCGKRRTFDTATASFWDADEFQLRIGAA